MSPQKARLVVDMIRGLKAGDAVNMLRTVNKRIAPTVEKVLQSAIANARNAAECSAIQQALRRNRHRLIDAARDLGVSRVTLYRLMERHGMRRPESEASNAGAA